MINERKLKTDFQAWAKKEFGFYPLPKRVHATSNLVKQLEGDGFDIVYYSNQGKEYFNQTKNGFEFGGIKEW